MLKIINGNLLNFTGSHIAHQCNCVPGVMGGLAGQILTRFPNTDTSQFMELIPGTNSIHPGEEHDTIQIVNMYAQVGTGKAGTTADGLVIEHADLVSSRLSYFRQCLFGITKLEGLTSIAFPYQIACGLGGGNWIDYEQLLINFAVYVDANLGVETWLIRYPSK